MSTKKGFSKKALDERIRADPQFAALYRKAVSDSIGESLREGRQRANLSQKDVAERMGVSESRVAQIEGATGVSMTLRTLRRYATAVDCRLDIELADSETGETITSVIVGDDRAEDSRTWIHALSTHAHTSEWTRIITDFSALIELLRASPRHQIDIQFAAAPSKKHVVETAALQVQISERSDASLGYLQAA